MFACFLVIICIAAKVGEQNVICLMAHNNNLMKQAMFNVLVGWKSPSSNYIRFG